MLRLIMPALLAALLLATPALAAGDVARERISLSADGRTASVEGRIRGEESREYLVAVSAGQMLTVSLATRNTSTYFNVWGPGKSPGRDEALFAGAISGDVFSQKIEEPGDYLVQVYLYRNAARRGEASRFTVNVELAGKSAPAGDVADGLTGGPDFWEVTGLAPGKFVNLRRAASATALIVGRVPDGTVLLNKGCKMEGAKRWCHVEIKDQPSISGWIAGQFLREAAVGAGGPSSDALVPGTNYHAVGRIPCTLAGQPRVKDCAFGVTRGEPGIGTIFITLPSGFIRVISFDGGKAAPQSGVKDFTQRREADDTIVTVNGSEESYVIPDAVINGG